MPLRRLALIAFAIPFLFPLVNRADASGDLVKASGPAVYYVDPAHGRYAFPTEAAYKTWYEDFSGVRTISDQDLASYRLIGNVAYRPGTRLVKITTDPKVYAVAHGGVLRWITSEEIARYLYGDAWAQQVDDLPDPFFINYRVGAPILRMEEFDRSQELGNAPSIAANQFVAVTVVSVPSPPNPTVPTVPPPNPTEPSVSPMPPVGNATSTCQMFDCLFPLEPERYDAPGTSVTRVATTGTSIAIGNSLYVRNDGLKDSSLYYTVWNKTALGCRVIDSMRVRMAREGAAENERDTAHDINGDVYTHIAASPTNALSVQALSGTLGYDQCMADAAANRDEDMYVSCRLLPHPGAWIFRDGADERVFESSQWSVKNYLQYSLMAQKKILAQMRQTFSAFQEAVPNMSALRGVLREPTGIGGLAISAGFYFTNGTYLASLTDQELARWSSLSDTPSNGVATATNAEGHEPWHVLLFSTQLGRWAYGPAGDQLNTVTLLNEGVAEYLRAPSNPGTRRSLDEWCAPTRLEDTTNHRSIAYTDPSIDPYTKGMCLFARIEAVCGLPALNQAFREALQQSYEPNATYPHFFGMVDGACADHAGYRQLLTNFGYTEDVLTLRRPLIPASTPLANSNACQD